MIYDPNAETRDWLREVTADPEPEEPPAPKRPVARIRDPHAGKRATKTVVKLIIANALVQTGLIATSITQSWDPTESIQWSLFVSAFFYGVAACIVGMRNEDIGLRPTWLEGSWRSAVGIGACVGAAVAIALSAVWTLAEGYPVVDSFAGILAGTDNLALLAGGALVVAVVAPLVEELVFRGFLTEALRYRGRGAALVLSGVAFSAAHLRFQQFRYYLLMGIGFAALYWARGLAASIAAHVSFNGILVVLAIASVHGPTQTHIADQFAVDLPAKWQSVTPPADVDLTMVGPSGATISIADVAIPGGAAIDTATLAAGLRSGVQLPDMRIDTESVEAVQLGIGAAVRVRAVVDGRQDHAVLTVTGDRLVVFELVPSGSAEAMRDFDRMLDSVRPV